MKLVLEGGHTVDLSPWLLRAVRGAFPLPGGQGRLAPFVPDGTVGEVLIREGVAAHDGNGDLVLTDRGREVHRLATAPEDGAESGGGRLTYSSELAPEELAEARAAEQQLRSGVRAFRWADPLPTSVRLALLTAITLLAAVPLVIEWYFGWFGAQMMAMVLLVLVGEAVLLGRVERFRRARRDRAPGAVLRKYARRCLAPAALDPVARGLLLRTQRAVDASPDPAALLGQEWELARELARHSLRRAEIEARTDPDERVLGLVDLLPALARTEARVRELEALGRGEPSTG
ncbi:hypothetical protein [Nocardiopsis ganjiahuensis]|uniref:hypothetical protein n=1 Tax=Nocardiopsis ganjiahuensis TaxID=239984 RepID=UPI000349861E|nr:hypothetical protein [Nocardiopsis ganjiahuensis]